MKSFGIVAILSALLASCTIHVAQSEFPEVLARERAKAPLASMQLNPDESELFARVLDALGAPRTYATHAIVDWPLPTAAAGVTRTVYISKSLLQGYRSGHVSPSVFSAVLAHEVGHLLMDHPVSRAFKSSTSIHPDSPAQILQTTMRLAAAAVVFRTPWLNTLVGAETAIGVAVTTARDLNEGKISIPEDETVAAVYFSPLSYNYPVDSEIEADNLAARALRKLYPGESPLATFLQLQLDILQSIDPTDKAGFAQAIKTRLTFL